MVRLWFGFAYAARPILRSWIVGAGHAREAVARMAHSPIPSATHKVSLAYQFAP